MYKFELTEDQIKKFEKWQKKHEPMYTGAIGGRYTFEFTPTSIGIAVVAVDNLTHTELNLTDYENW